MNLLVVPGTTLVAREICNSLSTAKGIRLFGAGYDIATAESFPYRAFDFAGILGSANLLGELEHIVTLREIDQIIFAHDSWIFEFRDLEFVKEAKIIKNSSSAIDTCSFKTSTYNFLREVVPTPEVYKSKDEVLIFPVFLKPNRGQGSVGAVKISSPEELHPFIDSKGCFNDQWVVSEFLPGEEYTIDCFSDLHGNIMYASPRIRISIKSGLAVETRVIEHPELSIWANLISKRIHLSGPWFFQVKEDAKGSLKLMEVGLRIAGGSGVQRLKGINLSQLCLLQFQGTEVEILNQNTYPNKLGSQINFGFDFKEIYVDYDDTVILNSCLNHELIKFLKLQGSEGIPVTLITRHLGNLEKSLADFHIRHIFSRIIHVTDENPKSKYVDTKSNFLFIDDSFRERLDVSLQFGNKVLVLDESFVLG